MATQKITVQQYDSGIKLIFPCTKNGIVEPIEGAEVFVKFKGVNTKHTFSRKCTITDAAMGTAQYVLVYNEEIKDTAVADKYDTEVEIRYANGTVLSTTKKPFILIISAEEIPM